jgi:general stress protein YciG
VPKKKTKGKPRGFAAMDKAKHLEAAARGGRKAWDNNAAHVFSSQEASQAGQIGGKISKRGKARTYEGLSGDDDKGTAQGSGINAN